MSGDISHPRSSAIKTAEIYGSENRSHLFLTLSDKKYNVPFSDFSVYICCGCIKAFHITQMLLYQNYNYKAGIPMHSWLAFPLLVLIVFLLLYYKDIFHLLSHKHYLNELSQGYLICASCNLKMKLFLSLIAVLRFAAPHSSCCCNLFWEAKLNH